MKVDFRRIKFFILDIKSLTEEIKEYISGKSIEEILEDKKTINAIKYLLIQISEAMLNVIQHLLAKEYGIAIKGYLDAISQALQKEIISREMYNELKPFFDFRHSLVHRYWIISDEILLKNLIEKKGYECFLRFCEEIENFLKRLEKEE